MAGHGHVEGVWGQGQRRAKSKGGKRLRGNKRGRRGQQPLLWCQAQLAAVRQLWGRAYLAAARQLWGWSLDRMPILGTEVGCEGKRFWKKRKERHRDKVKSYLKSYHSMEYSLFNQFRQKNSTNHSKWCTGF